MTSNINNQYVQSRQAAGFIGQTNNKTLQINELNNITLVDEKNTNTDAFVKSSKVNDGADDGKISFGEGVKSFCKGLISPVTSMFSSTKNFLIGAGMMLGGAALIAVTGGAAAPVLVAAGAAIGGTKIVKGAVQAANAKTDQEAKDAIEGIGAGTGIVAMSVAGAKSSLKASGVNTEGLNPLSATVKCFTTAPKNISSSISAFTRGKALANAKGILGIKENAIKSTNKPAESELLLEQPKNNSKMDINFNSEASNKICNASNAEINNKVSTPVEENLCDSTILKRADDNFALGRGETSAKPLKGESLDLSTSGNTKEIKFVTEGKDGLYSEHTVVLDSDPNISEVITAESVNHNDDLILGVYSRKAQFDPNYKVPQEAYSRLAKKYNLQGEALENFVSKLTDPSKIKSGQLERLAKLDLPTTTEEHYLYRGLNLNDNKSFGDIFLNAKKGDVITPDWGVSCATPDAEYAFSYTGAKSSHLLKINVPKDSRILGSYNWQGSIEFHMPAMSEYKYLGNKTIGGTTIHELEYISPNLSNYMQQ